MYVCVYVSIYLPIYECMHVSMYVCSISFLKHFSKQFVVLRLQWMDFLPAGRTLVDVALRVVEGCSTRGGIAQIQCLLMVETTVLAIHLER